MGQLIGTLNQRIKSGLIGAFNKKNVLGLSDDVGPPKVGRVKKLNDYERQAVIKLTPRTHDKVVTSASELSSALRWGKLKNYQVTNVQEQPGGTEVLLTLTDMSHSFRLVLDDPHSLRSGRPGRYILQENHSLDLVERPHIAILGKSGSGKSYLLMSLLYQFFDGGDTVVAIDPKNAELAKIAQTMEAFYTTLDNGQPTPIQLLNAVIRTMDKRQAKLADLDKLAVNAIDDLGKKPLLLVIEELPSLLSQLDKKEAKEFEEKLGIIARKGRSAGVELVLVSQQATVNAFGNSGIRDQIQNIIMLGHSTASQRSLVFPAGVEVPDTDLGTTKGTGWAYLDGLPVFKVEAPTFTFDLYKSIVALSKQTGPKA